MQIARSFIDKVCFLLIFFCYIDRIDVPQYRSRCIIQFNSIQFYLYSAKLQQLSSQGT